MRLPAITKRQMQSEVSRAFHERLYANHLVGEALVIPTNDPKVLQYQISGGQKYFWDSRNFKFHTKCVEGGLKVWLEPRAAEKVA